MATMKNIGGKPKLIRSYWCQPAITGSTWNAISLPFEVDPDKTLMLSGGFGYYPFHRHDSTAATPNAADRIKLNNSTEVGYFGNRNTTLMWHVFHFLWWPNAVVERGLTTFTSAALGNVSKHIDISLAAEIPQEKLDNQEVLTFLGYPGAFIYNTAINGVIASGAQLEPVDPTNVRLHWIQSNSAGSNYMPWQVIYWK